MQYSAAGDAGEQTAVTVTRLTGDVARYNIQRVSRPHYRRICTICNEAIFGRTDGEEVQAGDRRRVRGNLRGDGDTCSRLAWQIPST